jgi:predicted nucleotidyltransferase
MNMISVQDAFKKFKSNLEITQREQEDASRRQQEIRAVMNEAFAIEEDFLTGSYRRDTKTKPLKDVDIFCVFKEEERHYRDEPSLVILTEVETVLVKKYGREKVEPPVAFSVTVNFGVTVTDGKTDDKVMSFDVVPAFAKKDYFEVPNPMDSAGWTATNPKIHYDLAVDANAAYSGEWKGMVRMMKAWNRQNDKPIDPSFLIEVMALQLLYGDFQGDYRYEMKSFFASLADRIYDRWSDPAGYGPDVSDGMNESQKRTAKELLQRGEKSAAAAIQLEVQGKQGDALRAWRDIFGPLFPLS